MSIVECKTIRQYVSPDSIVFIDQDSSDSIRFHFVFNPLGNKVFFTGYPILVRYKNMYVSYESCDPKYALLSTGIDGSKVVQLSDRMRNIVVGKSFNSDEVIDELSRSLNVEKSRFVDVIRRNGQIQLEKSLASGLYEIVNELPYAKNIKCP